MLGVLKQGSNNLLLGMSATPDSGKTLLEDLQVRCVETFLSLSKHMQ